MVLSVLLVNVTTTDLFRDDSQYARLNISRFSSPRRPRSLTELSQQSFAKKGFHEIPFYSDVDLNVYFFVSLLVGTPPQRQSVILDTGSSLLGFPCNHCINCGRHIDPPFDPRISQTGYWVSCKHPMCVIRFCTTSLPRGKCKYFQGYSEGSEVSGAYFSDLVAIGETEKRSSFVRYHHIGCHSSETNLFLNQTANGIFGLSSWTDPPQKSLLEQLYDDSDVDARIFSLCASDTGGFLQIGGYNASWHIPSRTRPSSNRRVLGATQLLSRDIVARSLHNEADQLADFYQITKRHSRLLPSSELHEYLNSTIPIVWTPNVLLRGYGVHLTGIDFVLDEFYRHIPIDNYCNVDSGSTYTYFPMRVVTQFRKYLNELCSRDPQGHCSLSRTPGREDLCWTRVPSPTLPRLYPSLVLHLRDSGQVEWRPQSYFAVETNKDEWCIQIDRRPADDCVLGMSFFKHKNIIMDQENRLVGLVEASCPSAQSAFRPLFTPPIPPTSPNSVNAPGLRGQALSLVAFPNEDTLLPQMLTNGSFTPEFFRNFVDHENGIFNSERNMSKSVNNNTVFPTHHYSGKSFFQRRHVSVLASASFFLAIGWAAFMYYRKKLRGRWRRRYEPLESNSIAHQHTSKTSTAATSIPGRTACQIELPLYPDDHDCFDLRDYDIPPILPKEHSQHQWNA